MKKSIVILVVLMVSLCAFAGNDKPATGTQKKPVKIEKVAKKKPVLSKPVKIDKKVIKIQKKVAR